MSVKPWSIVLKLISPAFPDLERFMSEVTNRLKKLDLLDDILSRLVNMETHCQTIENEILEIREQLNKHTVSSTGL
jgi:predicted transcriptional regulator